MHKFVCSWKERTTGWVSTSSESSKGRSAGAPRKAREATKANQDWDSFERIAVPWRRGEAKRRQPRLLHHYRSFHIRLFFFNKKGTNFFLLFCKLRLTRNMSLQRRVQVPWCIEYKPQCSFHYSCVFVCLLLSFLLSFLPYFVRNWRRTRKPATRRKMCHCDRLWNVSKCLFLWLCKLLVTSLCIYRPARKFCDVSCKHPEGWDISCPGCQFRAHWLWLQGKEGGILKLQGQKSIPLSVV